MNDSLLKRCLDESLTPSLGASGLCSAFLMPLLLALLSIPLFFHHLAVRDLWSSHEPRAAQNARSIIDTGDWLLPRLGDGRVELQKPPLYYWLAALCADGAVDAWAVRLPAALSALGTVLLVYVFLWRQGRPCAGFLAAALLATMMHFTWLARVGRTDMPLTFCLTAVVTGLFLGRRLHGTGNRLEAKAWLLLGYTAIAAAVLLKGPIGIVLAALVVGAQLMIECWAKAGELGKSLRSLGILWGIPVVLLLSVPWFIHANMRTDGEFFRVFFLHHNFARGLGMAEELESHPWWFYFYRVPFDLFPWSLLVPLAGFNLLRGHEDDEARLGMVWFISIFLFLSCMSFKRADYLLPAYPGAAILLGCCLERGFAEATGKARRTVIPLFAATLTVCAIGWVVYVDVLLPRWEPMREDRRFASEIRERAQGLVLLFRTESHALVHHLGRPIDRIMEWENLDIWACRPLPVYVVMPPEEAEQCEQFLEAGRLHRVCSNVDLAGGKHDRPLVLLCTRPVEP